MFANPGLPDVGVGIQIDPLPGHPLTGSARVSLGAAGEHAPCFLSAVELQVGVRCRFFVARAGGIPVTVTLDDPRYTLGSGLLSSLLIREQSIFANGFE